MERRSFDSPRFRMHGLSPYGPSRSPFSPNSPRLLNPWHHSPSFRQQYIPHYSGPTNQPLSHSTPKDSPSGSSWYHRHPKKPKHNYSPKDVGIEHYIKDSMLEDPWLHLEKCQKESLNHEKKEKIGSEHNQINTEHSVESNHQQQTEVGCLDGSACHQEKIEAVEEIKND